MKKPALPPPCPCDTGLPYDACCGRFHAGEPAPDARALMRSRYSAYVLGLADYLHDTWATATRPRVLDRIDLNATRWLGLDLKRFEVAGDAATVEFVARYRVGGGSAARMHETSRFVREGGRWFYVDGDVSEG
jgi:SEC-C motif domain protein